MIRLALLFLAVFTWIPAAHAAPPSIRELGIDPVSLAPILGDSQLILLHKPRKLEWTRDGEKLKKNVSFVSSLRVIAAPVTTVRDVVTSFKKYPEILPQVKEVTISKQGAQKIVEYETKINLAVMNMGVDYTLAYTDEPNGDVTWHLVEGDVGENIGRWEFFALPGGKTLAVMTNWVDFESLGFTIRTVFRAQPDLKIAMPVASAAVVMNAMYRRASGLPRDEVKPTSASLPEPIVPMISSGEAISLPTLRKLAEAGSIVFIHPVQWFKDKKGRPVDFLLVSSASLVSVPVEKARMFSTSFERYPEFMPQVARVKVKGVDDKLFADWRLKLGFSIFTIPVDYTLEYWSVSEQAMRFKRKAGDLDYVYGAWEWIDVGDGKSLITYTTGSQLGDEAPYILKIGKDIPNRDLAVGVSTAAVVIKKIAPWMEHEATKENPVIREE